MLEHMLNGGPIMIPLMLLSVLALAVIVDRIRAFREAEIDTAGLQQTVIRSLEKGDVVLLVEDVVTTGGQLLEAAKTLEDAGAKIERIVAVIDRGEGGRENIEAAGYSFESILTRSDLGIA